MAGKLDKESRIAIQTLTVRGSSASSIARTLGVTEGAVRYHQRRQAAGTVPGYQFTPEIQRWEPGGTFTFEIREAR